MTRGTTSQVSAAASELICDEELVAVCLVNEWAWPGPLPTVDLNDAEDVVRAAVYGQRSLFLRGQTTSDGAMSEVLTEALRPVIDSSRSVSVYAADDEYQVVDPRVLTAFEVDDGWLLDEIVGLGLHRLSALSTGEVAALVEAVIDGAAATVAEGAVSFVCVANARRDGASLIAAQPGSGRAVVLGADGRRMSDVAIEPDGVVRAALKLLEGEESNGGVGES